MQLQRHYCDGCNRIFEECVCYPDVMEGVPHPADSAVNLVTQAEAGFANSRVMPEQLTAEPVR